MRILGTICARGGSKGIKNKNIRLFLGKPLIYYSIQALKEWGKCDRIIFSTDSEEIKKIAVEYGAEAPFLRSNELATDDASKIDVWKHIISYCEKEEHNVYDYIVDLDPTSPIRLLKDIEESYQKIIKKDADIIFSVYPCQKNPYFNMVEIDEDGYAKLCKKPNNAVFSRQKAPEVYSLNASIYIIKRDFLKKMNTLYSGKAIVYKMSDISIDIDREIDFKFLEFLIKNGEFKFDY